MSNMGKELYEFGPFRLDSRKRVLMRDNQPVPLQLKAFETLLVLVRNSEQVVLKDDLMKSVWPDTFVEESNLAQNIFVLRKTLGDTAGNQRYIVTIPGRGYSFTEKVRTVSQEETLVLESRSRTHLVIDEEILPGVDKPALVTKAILTKSRRKWAFGLATLVVAVVAFALRPTLPPPKVLRIRHITHLGSLVHNTKLLTDGARIYFRAWEGSDRVIRYVSPEGGEVFPLEKPFPQIDLDDISASGSEFLAVNLGDRNGGSISDGDAHSVWRVPLPSGSPRPLGNLRANDSRWSPDGRAIACAVGSDLFLANPDGTIIRKLATLPSDPIYLVWSPDSKRIRFSVADPGNNGVGLWQVDLTSNTVRRLLPDWPNSKRLLPGGWTPDGGYFFFTLLGDGTTNIWAMREKDELWRRVDPQPVQITAGPLTFYPPSSGKDGKTVFAVGEQLRGQLDRYDPASQQFIPYSKGISADHIAFSHDGRWMAYIEFPQGVLVRNRLDGSERRQLTFPPMRAFSPKWSPDDSQIAFQASAQPGANNKIYLISSSGGVPVLAAPDARDRQTYPSWASDGSSILFSTSDENWSNLSLQSLDWKTKRVAPLPNTAGLYEGQLSPDGRYVSALADATHGLMLYEIVTHKSRVLAEQADYPRWSADGQYIYFCTTYFGAHRKPGGGIYRWKASTDTIETVVEYPDFLLAGVYGVSFGLTPDGEILILRDLSARDLYALDLELP
jgi:DNA-binding winged helix-turn-helix (wHTH) protein/Tol biopolymer transport system component